MSVAAEYGFALAGGYAVQAHGMGHRPSGDVDLFTSWEQRTVFTQAVAKVVQALRAHGYQVSTDVRGETFARLSVQAPDTVEPDKVELAADWRAHPPVTLSIGPVLHPDDAVANKMCALFGRAAPRDFLDVDAAIASGRYTRERLLELAAEADPGFDRRMFADALNSLKQITDTAFAQYDVEAASLTEIRTRFAAWAEALSATGTEPIPD